MNYHRWDPERVERLQKLAKQSALERYRLKTYGITPEQYATLWNKQGEACAICRTSVNGSGRAWHVDHDHDTGYVRGILCHRCNVSLGRSKVLTSEQARYLANPPAELMFIAPPLYSMP